MKEAYGFIEFETPKEFKNWLDNQKISRKINKLQVHHTYMPSYKNWETDDALRRQQGIKEFHMKTNGWGDIAQHFLVCPNGHIVTGRDLEKTPIGIKGWNTGAICIEIYGDFDKGKDVMTKEQKDAVIMLYALLSEKFNVPIDETGIRCHGWFTYDGTYLGGYDSVKSCKTCPGTNFMGFGNTKTAFKENFYPLVKEYKYKEENKIKYLRVIYDGELNIHNKPDFKEESICGFVPKGTALTIVEEVERKGTNMYLTKAGFYITASSKYVETFER